MVGKRTALLSAMAVIIGTGVAAAPAVVASAPHDAKPTSVSLTSSDNAVKSSTKQSINVAIEASSNPTTPVNDTLVVVLSKGIEQTGETHDWTFPITANALKVAATGAGTLIVPAKDIAPFGAVSLKIKPIGKISSNSCQNTLTSKSVKVSLTGVFFFDSLSTGRHAWGTVGSRKSFTFAATNTVTWLFSSAASENCGGPQAPCAAGTIWGAQANGVAFDGLTTSQGAVVRASRAVSLAKPHDASRVDSNVAPTIVPTVNPDAQGDAVMTVSGIGKVATGSATITSHGPATLRTTPCGSSDASESSQFFTGDYANGTPPLTVAEQIFGKLSLADNGNGTVDQTKPI